jgi:hypothetical protein
MAQPLFDCENEMGHYHTTKSGRVLPSVTTIINDTIPPAPGLVKWQKMQGPGWKNELNRLAIIGTLVHDRILSPLSMVPRPIPDVALSDYPDGVEDILEIAEDMWNSLGLKISTGALVEHFMVNEIDGYCGQFDLYGTIDGVKTLLDLKTSRRAYDNHYIQAGGYARLLDFEPEQAFIVSVCPYIEKNPHLEPEIYEIEHNALVTFGNRFKRLCDKWHTQNKHGKSKRRTKTN